MVQDDMEVIMYKILAYLYGCMKAGKRPRQEDICCDCQLFHVPQHYWEQVTTELAGQGFVRGIIMIPTKDGRIIQITSDACVTLRGREFLRDNSGMQMAGKMLGKAFEVLLDGIIAAIT